MENYGWLPKFICKSAKLNHISPYLSPNYLQDDQNEIRI